MSLVLFSIGSLLLVTGTVCTKYMEQNSRRSSGSSGRRHSGSPLEGGGGMKAQPQASTSYGHLPDFELLEESKTVAMTTRKPSRRGRKPTKVDTKTKLERSRQSARECRARKKLRYQYLEELVSSREKAIYALREELETCKGWCAAIDNGNVPTDLIQCLQKETDQAHVSKPSRNLKKGRSSPRRPKTPKQSSSGKGKGRGKGKSRRRSSTHDKENSPISICSTSGSYSAATVDDWHTLSSTSVALNDSSSDNDSLASQSEQDQQAGVTDDMWISSSAGSSQLCDVVSVGTSPDEVFEASLFPGAIDHRAAAPTSESLALEPPGSTYPGLHESQGQMSARVSSGAEIISGVSSPRYILPPQVTPPGASVVGHSFSPAEAQGSPGAAHYKQASPTACAASSPGSMTSPVHSDPIIAGAASSVCGSLHRSVLLQNASHSEHPYASVKAAHALDPGGGSKVAALSPTSRSAYVHQVHIQGQGQASVLKLSKQDTLKSFPIAFHTPVLKSPPASQQQVVPEPSPGLNQASSHEPLTQGQQQLPTVLVLNQNPGMHSGLAPLSRRCIVNVGLPLSNPSATIPSAWSASSVEGTSVSPVVPPIQSSTHTAIGSSTPAFQPALMSSLSAQSNQQQQQSSSSSPSVSDAGMILLPNLDLNQLTSKDVEDVLKDL